MTITKYNTLFKIYLLYALQCPSEWGTYYILMNVGYVHTIYVDCSMAAIGLCMRSTFLPKEPPTKTSG